MRLKLFGDSADSLAAHERLFVGGAERQLLSVRGDGKGAVARFEGVADRSAAEALARLSWSRSTAPRCRRSTRANIITPT